MRAQTDRTREAPDARRSSARGPKARKNRSCGSDRPRRRRRPAEARSPRRVSALGRVYKWRADNLVCPDRQDCLSSTLRTRRCGGGGRWRWGRWWRAVIDVDVAVHCADLQRISAAVYLARHAAASGMRMNIQRKRGLEVAVHLREVAEE